MLKAREDLYEEYNNIWNIINEKDKLLIELINAEKELSEAINDIDEFEDNEVYKQYNAILNEYKVAIILYKKNWKESLKSHISNLERNIELYKSKLTKNEKNWSDKIKKIILELNKKINSLDKIIKWYFSIKAIKYNIVSTVDDILIPKIEHKNT